MIDIFAFVPDPPAISTEQWLEASIYMLEQSKIIGAKIYPFVYAVGIVRTMVALI
jgi:hypothetical protein